MPFKNPFKRKGRQGSEPKKAPAEKKQSLQERAPLRGPHEKKPVQQKLPKVPVLSFPWERHPESRKAEALEFFQRKRAMLERRGVKTIESSQAAGRALGLTQDEIALFREGWEEHTRLDLERRRKK